ncbi:hypothetical protein C3941_19830 [Kaistia algarum]|uniref:baseplate J/gp47 family protein n=1 Tax=Kaistia algarum TaxID=2083279 RepID=UPI000CE8A216|nr:baseplate J/gp47 family protein [Kaistia algarum]MCX5516243.1 baseplate J/gp47 family protein [Kaistia algarum]PPE78314.1 hypothetical protein C3941_19830 [Kaistia algarum]
MSAPVCTIDATGIHVPSYDDVLAYFQTEFRGIYGSDVYLGNDSQDGQWVAILALAHYDSCTMAAAVYNSYSPTTGQGAGLSSNVKINGIARAIPTHSTVDLTIIGQAGTVISTGIATDGTHRWFLPSTVTIPPGGEIIVTASAEDAGAVEADPGTITTIGTPTRGWQTVTNVLAATAGAPVESDADLRRRQKVSTALPSLTVLEGIAGAVATIEGVTRYAPYENDTNVTDGDGVPPHSIAMVVEGGDAQAIAVAIASKKTPGAYTYGTTAEVVTDRYGLDHTIRFFRPTAKRVKVEISLTALTGYTSGIGTEIQTAVAQWLSELAIGEDVRYFRIAVPANLDNGADSKTYTLTDMQIAFNGDPLGYVDLTIAFNEAAFADPADITLVVT